MERRRLLAATGAAFAGAVAGCVQRATVRGGSTARDTTESAVPAAEDPSDRRPVGVDAPGNATALARRGDPASVCALAPNHGFSIRELVEPTFASGWTDATVPDRYSRGPGRRRRGIGREASVIGLVRDGLARAYPLVVVAEHEIVNDSFGGPLLVTYCPRCRTGMTAERRVGETPTTFHVSGHLWRVDGSEENLVLYDRATGSYWSQLLARAICGPVAGAALELIPTTFTTWGAWLDAHPETDVLLPPPASSTA